MKIKTDARMLLCVAAWTAAHTMSAQTHIDLRTQAKSPDLSSMGPTKPAQTGNVLPATCSVGEVYFLISATAGTNLMLCASQDHWNSSGGATGALATQANGTAAGTAQTLNFAPGTYVSQTITCGSATCSYQPDVDTTKIPTNAVIQAGQLNAVITTSSSAVTYTGVMASNDPIPGYAANQQLIWNVGSQSCAGGPMTLNIDGLGAVPLKQADGVTDLTSLQCGAGAQLAIIYDAVNTVFRGPWGGSGTGGGASNSVSGVAAVAPFTSTGGTTPVIGAVFQGNGSLVQLSTGSTTTNDCVKFDANGNTVDSGAPCGGSASPIATTTLQPFGGVDSAFGTVSQVATPNSVWYAQFFVPSPGISFTAIKGFQSSSGNAGNMAMGVYDGSCSLLAQSKTVTGTGVQTAVAFAFARTTLTPGTYFVAFSSDNPAATFFAADVGYNGYLWNFSESASSYRIFKGANTSVTAAGVTTMPSACGARTPLQSQGVKYTPWLAIQ